jgi:hypothetical protein
VNWSADLSYLYTPEESVPVWDITTQTGGNADYPSAQAVTLSLIISVDID